MIHLTRTSLYLLPRVSILRHEVFPKRCAQGFQGRGLAQAWREAKKEGILNCIVDGNLLLTKMWGNKDTRLVGIDKFGNKYFEKPSGTAGRTRWVEYADKKYYNASNVPPEWHGWLHYVTDHTAEQLEDLRPKRYGLEHQPNRTGEGEQYIYHSKGHVLSPNQRDWSRYDPWKKADAAPMS